MAPMHMACMGHIARPCHTVLSALLIGSRMRHAVHAFWFVHAWRPSHPSPMPTPCLTAYTPLPPTSPPGPRTSGRL